MVYAMATCKEAYEQIENHHEVARNGCFQACLDVPGGKLGSMVRINGL